MKLQCQYPLTSLKTSDTVWYETLINKLANLNFGNSSIKIILSYEGNRQQYAQLVDKKTHINQYILGFQRVASLVLFYLIYTFHHYRHVQNSNLFNMHTLLVYAYQISSEISNLQYQFSKLTLKIWINGPKIVV